MQMNPALDLLNAGAWTLAEALQACAWIAKPDLAEPGQEWGLSLSSPPDEYDNSWSVSLGRYVGADA